MGEERLVQIEKLCLAIDLEVCRVPLRQAKDVLCSRIVRKGRWCCRHGRAASAPSTCWQHKQAPSAKGR